MNAAPKRTAALALLLVLASCQAEQSTLALDVSVATAGLAIETLHVEVKQAGRSIVARDFAWKGNAARFGVFLPGSVSGAIDVQGEARDGNGRTLATAAGSALISPGTVSALVPLVLQPTSGDVGAPDAGAPDGDGPDAAGLVDGALDADAPDDAAVDVPASPPDLAPAPDGAPDTAAACTPGSCPNGAFCVDGQCCATACTDPCWTCATGTCQRVRNGPDRECAQPNMCDGNGSCLSPPLNVPRPLRPFNGETTGSVFSDRALRPHFSWIWSKNATSYDLEVDDSCPSNFQVCVFPSPEVKLSVPDKFFVPTVPLPVSKTAPVGRRYYWRIRGCNGGGCTAWSPVRYVDVGRQAKDFNGDGYADVFAGSGGASVAEVWLGGPAFDTTPDLEIRLQSSDRVFIAAPGDVNGDGFGDLLVGNAKLGKAFLYLGGTSLRTTPVVTFESPPGASNFGAAVAGAGDVDGDSWNDILIGAPSYPGSGIAPAVYLYKGGAVRNEVAATFAGTLDSELGRSISSAGDFNGDGYADFLVGTNAETHLWKGGLTVDPQPVHVFPFYARKTDGGMASIGDFNGDGYADFIIAEDDSPQVMLGDSQFIGAGGIFTKAGNMVAGGDVDGDVFDDVVLGRGNDTVYVFRGGNPWSSEPVVELKAPAPGEIYPASVSVAGDLDGDGFAEVLVGAPNHGHVGQPAGGVYLFRGGGAIDATPFKLYLGAQDGDVLGSTVAFLHRIGRLRRSPSW